MDSSRVTFDVEALRTYSPIVGKSRAMIFARLCEYRVGDTARVSLGRLARDTGLSARTAGAGISTFCGEDELLGRAGIGPLIEKVRHIAPDGRSDTSEYRFLDEQHGGEDRKEIET